jgi:hypothetical protein
LTRIPFFSFGNIVAIKVTGFEIRTVSKSEQRTAVGCGLLQWKSRQLIAPDAAYHAYHMITNAITRSRVGHFMNKFRKLGLISYNGNNRGLQFAAQRGLA